MLENIKSLPQLWEAVDKINKQHYPENKLKPILGGGCSRRPKFMFVFINPTHANISSDPAWSGPRFPFIGTKPVWRIFHRAGFFDSDLMAEIEKVSVWSLRLTRAVESFLKNKSFYFTNIVKWTGADASLPDAGKVNLFLPFLEKETALVQPEYIVTFGLIPFARIAGQKIKLADYYEDVKKAGKLKFYNVFFAGRNTKVIPCYFPVGRGNPQRAVELLQLLSGL